MADVLLGSTGSPAPLECESVDWVGRPKDPPVGAFVGLAGGELAARARGLEYEVFAEQGYCEPSVDGRVTEYAKWEAASRFHVVVTDADELIATVRTTAGCYDDLPVGKFERWDSYPPDIVVEYASLVVPRSARGAGGAEALYRSVVHEAVAIGAGGLVAIGEQWLLDLLNGVYDFGFRQLGPSRWYMGGECFPMGTSMADLWVHLRTRQPTLYAWFLEGIDRVDLRDSTGSVQAPGAAMPALLPVAGA